VYSNLPWILPAYYTLATLAGAAILRVQVPPRLLHDLTAAVESVSWSGFREVARTLAPLAWSYMLGSTLGALILALIAYRVALAAVLAHRARHGTSLQSK